MTGAAGESREWLDAAAREVGADLVGVADLVRAGGLETDPPDLFHGFSRAVVMGLKLPDAPVDTCTEGPTPVYALAYRTANDLLDRMAFRLARRIEAEGHRALPLPASQLLDRERLTGHVSYKALGRLAGLGWQGKSLLLVNPEYGPRFRMVAVLTDWDLAADAPVRNRCGSCSACAEACPAGAIRNVGTEDHYRAREEALRFDRCAEFCMACAARPHIEKPICGVCVRVCPWGSRRRGTRTKNCRSAGKEGKPRPGPRGVSRRVGSTNSRRA